MSNAQRKKPTKAEVKAKRAKRQIVMSDQSAFANFAKTVGNRKIVLHAGCGLKGPKKLHKSFQNDQEWAECRLDINADVEPDVVADMVDLSAIPDNSVHAVWSSHNIEHLYAHQVSQAFAEFYRVLKPEGHFLMTLPDMQTIATYVAHGDLEEPIYDSPIGPVCPIDIMFGMRSALESGNEFMAHRTAFTAKTLAERLRDIGFCNLRIRRDWPDLWAVGYKLPFGHPQRVEKIMVEQNRKDDKLVMPQPLPINRSMHPGTIQAGLLTDELDIPPKVQWEPLGLNDN